MLHVKTLHLAKHNANKPETQTTCTAVAQLASPKSERRKEVQRTALHKVRRLGVTAFIQLEVHVPVLLAWPLAQRLPVDAERASVASWALRVASRLRRVLEKPAAHLAWAGR